ncbi:STAS domain-containing protein [Streptomyces tirandamycinicus]|uniref:Anti-sigma factor antagonist n=1 Tax=Streptomyces tirandamycinicus TaxID=2174846 RepID=A0A2S1SZ96_9ACTN|nr:MULTISPECIES: STAS domain-containing protein [Streptomyces]AWI31718.1 anti-sigma factor antagonist [Streptomyces tirandamycinicus]MCY0981979.1 STAS domain-containing protein [Streptomyces tirandamycinicus]NNJ04733.1 STAS domain-containing protein [Streptomyces sp. PKU-MA01144]TFE55805.1 anti-sigma factor antagonist [Streptomyces sp. ICN441]
MDASSEDQSRTDREARPDGEGPVGAQYAAGDAWVIAARGDLDMTSLPPLDDALASASAEHSTVILDVSGVTFGDSAFLNLLLRVHQKADLRVAKPQPQLRRLLEITGADKVLDVRHDLDAVPRP